MQKALPTSFSKYFWDAKPTDISLDNNATYIVERLLELGDLEELEWLGNTYSKDRIIQTLQNSRRISPKTGNFFSLYYGVPKESLACMKQHLM